MLAQMRRPRRLACSAMLAVTVATGCSAGASRSDEAPIGFGVRDEDHLAEVLTNYAVSPDDAECVARIAFVEEPSVPAPGDGSFYVDQTMLAVAGDECGIDWSDYNFTSD